MNLFWRLIMTGIILTAIKMENGRTIRHVLLQQVRCYILSSHSISMTSAWLHVPFRNLPLPHSSVPICRHLVRILPSSSTALRHCRKSTFPCRSVFRTLVTSSSVLLLLNLIIWVSYNESQPTEHLPSLIFLWSMITAHKKFKVLQNYLWWTDPTPRDLWECL